MGRLCRWWKGTPRTVEATPEDEYRQRQDERDKQEIARRVRDAEQRLQMLQWQTDVETRERRREEP